MKNEYYITGFGPKRSLQASIALGKYSNWRQVDEDEHDFWQSAIGNRQMAKKHTAPLSLNSLSSLVIAVV